MSGPFLPQETIRAKRDGAEIAAQDIKRFVSGIQDGQVTHPQAAAFLMAAFLKGMTRDEAIALTEGSRDSGDVLAWDLPGPVVDKHSTGGVGDVVSLMLAPMVAACGGYVPMISGRGLGHTGGTLDKLESVPGYSAKPDNTLFRDTVREVGCAIIGQTGALAPIDGTLYGLRDVTGTVESVPLITASILSKKLAAGLDALVLDVKTGSGAFMATRKDAQELADSLVAVANGAGMRTSAVLTDMNEPLAKAAGNALEVRVALDYLSGAERDPRLHAVTMALSAEMLVSGGLAADLDEATAKLTHALDGGEAAERFARMIARLGGPADLFDRMDAHLASAPVVRDVTPEGTGRVTSVDTRKLGLAVVALGGGRTRSEDAIDPSVGLDRLAGIGDETGPDVPLARVHARSEEDAVIAAEMVREAYAIGEAGEPGPTIVGRVGVPG